MRLLLHACCGPCSLESTRALAQAGHELVIDYENPNIHPAAEYERRLTTLRDYVAAPQGLELHEGAYDPDTWEARAGVHGTDREKRCRACYRLRFERAARLASDLGCEGLCTTLTISPYQFTDVIFEELRRAAGEVGIEAVCEDFRGLYRQTTWRAKELGMYRQNYCGCRFSIEEACVQREAAKADRARRKALRTQARLTAAAEGSVNQASQL